MCIRDSPYILKDGDDYYMTASGGGAIGQKGFVCWHSKNLQDWSDPVTILDFKDVCWAEEKDVYKRQLLFISFCIICIFDSKSLNCMLLRASFAASSCSSTPHTFRGEERPHHRRGIAPQPVPKSAQSSPLPGIEKWARRMVSVLKR